MVLIPLSSATKPLSSSSGKPELVSSNPPGQNGTLPAFPRTKFLLGPGARSSEVDVRPVEIRGLDVWAAIVKIREINDLERRKDSTSV
jgi:hypothetical protein